MPRLKEIINVSKRPKTPSLTVALRKDLAGDRAMAKNVQSMLEYTTLHSVAAASEVWYDPNPTDTVIEEDKEFVRSYYEMPDEEVDVPRISPWLLRIELNREMMVDKKLLMADLAEREGLTRASESLGSFESKDSRSENPEPTKKPVRRNPFAGNAAGPDWLDVC